ncbi:MAG: DUF58 domain-containing protein [Sedimentisphaerales bacterium]|nr:DUF58 domain-containing protein [Sedimentisphaerales bacterium]
MNETFGRYLLDGQRAGTRYGIAIPHTIQRGLFGNELSNRSGSSLEFMDHREYVVGDDLRRIDWSAFARSDKLSIKLFRDEVNSHVDIILDCSGSMALENTAKLRASLGLAALFSQAAANCDYTFTAWQAGDTCLKIANGADRPVLWEGISFESSVGCEESFRKSVPAWRRRSIRVLLSDLFWMGDPSATLGILADGASAVFIIQILAERDLNLPRPGNIRLHDCETGRVEDMFVDTVAREQYRRNLANHQHNWNRACRRFGAVIATVVAERIVEQWALDDLVLGGVLKVL